MKIPLILLAIFMSLSSFSQDESKQKKKTLIGLRAGLNYSLLRSDQFDVEAGGRPLAGLFMQHYLSRNFSIETSLSYSNKGSHSTIPYYKLSNQYVEPEILLGVEIFDGCLIHSGLTYSHLLTENMITIDGDGSFGIDKTPIDAFSSEISIPIGIDQRLFDHVCLSTDFYVPTSKTGTINLSVSLKIPLNTKPSKISYRKMKVRASRKQIKEMKEGALLVRLKTSANTIAALRKTGHNEEAAKRVEEQYIENQKIRQAFSKHFNFCRVAFFYSDKSKEVAEGSFKNIFLDDRLQIDSSISIEPETEVFTAEFGRVKPDTMQYFSHYSLELNEHSIPVQSANYYSSSTNVNFDALVIMDRNFIQLNKPFPFYSRFIFHSMKQHPEQGLFIFPLFAHMSWSYDECVKRLDQKLSKYFEKINKD